MQYNSKDLDVINKVLRFYPDVDELVAIIKRVSKAKKFPLNSRPELMNILATEKEPAGKEKEEGPTAAGVRRSISLLPAYYFPIASADDLIAKLVEFRAGVAPVGGGLGPFEEVASLGAAAPVVTSQEGLRAPPPPEPPSPPLPLEPASTRLERPTPAE
jgi:hypothetical protein